MAETSYVKLRALGETIRGCRMRMGLSQEAFAEKCGLHRTYVGHVERAEANISFENILKISAALHLSPSQLFRRAGL